VSTPKEDTVAAIMTRKLVTVSFDAPVKKALATMIRRDIGSLIVLKKGEPVGIITERDVTRNSLLQTRGKKIYERPVARLMSHPLITVPSTTPTWKAFETMVTRKIRRLPIEGQGRLVGIVTERDLFKWALRVFYEPNIPKHIRRFL
jgi:CBS domain-containing protein